MADHEAGKGACTYTYPEKPVCSVYMESVVFVPGFEEGVYVFDDFVDHGLCLGFTAAARGSFVWFIAFIEQTNGASGTRYSMTCSV